ncbi:Insect cuticle protein [Oryctes borbonicus]|uniref:Insect cuticle protein n=1 Tax=Oryctes borbonicus TaxID=1629725 RepID=A0A0T6BB64_9SCAR|nr:Insect cuticle protein [Oryctes borbonicus]
MAFKFVIFATCLAIASASVAPLHGLAYSTPLVTKTVVDTDYDHNPQYSYSYGVHDALTGDSKSQTESRHGDFVSGQYSLIDSDGSKRTVDYAADPVNGFNAVVSKTPAVAKIIAKVAAPIVAAPIVAKVAAPAVAQVATYSAAPAIATYSAIPAVATYAAHVAPVATYATAPISKTIIQGPSAISYTAAHAAPLAHSTYAAPLKIVW